MATVNPAFLDYDFQAGPGLTGCVPRVDAPGDDPALPIFEDAVALIPESEWPDRIAQHQDMEHLVQKTKDQGSEGSCTSNAFSQLYESAYVRQFGADKWIETSPISLYRQCASGPSTGSSLPDNVRMLREVGILPTDTPENRQRCQTLGIPAEAFHPNTGYYNRPPNKWPETALMFRVDGEHFDVTSFEGIMTGLLGHHLIGYARDSHCILAVTPIYEDGGYILKYKNSWGQWGDNGYGYDSRRKVESGLRTYGAISCRGVLVPPGLVR